MVRCEMLWFGFFFVGFFFHVRADVCFCLSLCRCIHCKAMEAMMLELALHYRDDPHITFFRMDAQKNELANRSVKLVGLPSMYLFPAEDKMNPVFFDGERRLQDLVDFIDLHRHGKVDAGGTVPPVAAGASAVGEHVVDVSGN